MSRLLSITLIVAVWFSVASPVSAEEKPKSKGPRPAAAKCPSPGANEAAIEKALASPTEFEFCDTPLSDAICFLKDRHEIPIQLDNRALEDMGIGSDMPINMDLKGISLRSALNLMLKELNLAWIIRNEVLLITTPEEADMHQITKVLDVSDLVVCRNKDGELWDDYDPLVDTITSCAGPTTWDEVGGAGSISGVSLGTAKILVVSQTYVVHEEIAQLLAEIREIAKKNPNGDLPLRDKPRPKHRHRDKRSQSER